MTHEIKLLLSKMFENLLKFSEPSFYQPAILPLVHTTTNQRIKPHNSCQCQMSQLSLNFLNFDFCNMHLQSTLYCYVQIIVMNYELRNKAYVFRTSTPEHFGTGIYLVASLLNHSCSPNCTVVFQGRQLSIVATKDVPSGRQMGH